MGNLDLIWNLALAVGAWCLLCFLSGLVEGHRKARARLNGTAVIAERRVRWCLEDRARRQDRDKLLGYLLTKPNRERWATVGVLDAKSMLVPEIPPILDDVTLARLALAGKGCWYAKRSPDGRKRYRWFYQS